MKNNIKKGRLTIYTSYSPGAGKTHIMLRDALQNYGEKVVIGFLNGKERKIKGSNIKPVYHYSLDKIVSKYNFENVVIMDEMGMGGKCEDDKSFIYEDIEKILNAGINVYTSTNLKRFQNVNSSFKEISGIGVKKTIPIRFLEMADRIVFVDRKPELLENDYKNGELFCNKNQNSRIMQKNFNPEILKKYRVISLEILKEYRNKIEIIENNDKNI